MHCNVMHYSASKIRSYTGRFMLRRNRSKAVQLIIINSAPARFITVRA